MLHNFHMVQLLIMDMTWHFLWERSLLIPALKDLHFVFSHWLQEQFLSPMSIRYLCTGNLRIYVASDILSVGYHLRYPGKCYNLEQVQHDQRWRWHEDVMMWAMLCRTARDSFASRLEPSQLNVGLPWIIRYWGERLLRGLTFGISGVTLYY